MTIGIIGSGQNRQSTCKEDYPSADETVGYRIKDLVFKVVEPGNLEQAGYLTDVGKPLSGLNLVSYPT